ncbi:histone deacetylase [Apiospora phragmitis]|uniref:Histone deacetylase n=1 Tax=Apiospora phragmitis TaxID=2905665 RepID=A0ABR1TTA4_9PEZI
MEPDPASPYRFRVPKPNYLPHNIDADEPIFENAHYFNKVKRMAHEYGITKPKGYNVTFHYNPNMERHHFGQTHPMKPWRLTLTKSLVTSYGMNFAMDNYTARTATYEELTNFHTKDYVDFLATVAPQPTPLDVDNMHPDLKFNLGGSDCPLFEGLYDYCSMSAGSSLDAARKIYVHHGDGVEEAFLSTDRVMTVSFHKYDPNTFFPGTGALDDNGPKSEHNPGAHHALNVPLNDGITDEQYAWLFENVISRCVEKFRPSAIALQCGADSLAGDRLGKFNLLVEGHSSCVEYCKKLGIPLIMFGGGGYTPRNVARAWAYETAVAIGQHKNIPTQIPEHTPWRERFRHETLLPTIEQILGEPRQNRNPQKKLQDIVQHVTEQLRFVSHAPSVQYQVIPPDLGPIRDEVEQRLKEEAELHDDNARKLREEAMGVPMEM